MLKSTPQFIEQNVSKNPITKISLEHVEQVGKNDQVELPSPRAGHSLTRLSNNKYILFGGASHEQGFLSDLHRMSFVQGRGLVWENIKLFTSLSGPEARYEHSCLSIKKKHKNGCHDISGMDMLVLYGAGKEGPLRDCWIFDTDASGWILQETKGTIPSARVIKSACYFESTHRVYIFGGGLHNNVPVSDGATYCLDLNSLRWVMVAGELAPHPSHRLGHSMTLVGSKLYLFGGLSHDLPLNDVWVFDIASNKWSELETTGPKPAARCAHSCIVLGNQLIVAGGMSPLPPTAYDTIHILNIDTLIWNSFPCQELKRLDHSVTFLDDGRVLFLGGMDFEHVFNDGQILSL